MASLYQPYPPKLSQDQLDHLLSSIKDWTAANGLVVRPSPALISNRQDSQDLLAVPAPVTLYPSYFPRKCFEEASNVQKAYNELYARISMDEQWLGRVIQE